MTYVILMRRGGNLDGHTYIGGVYDDLSTAEEVAEEEANFRGGKYEYQIFSCRGRDMTVVVSTCR